MNKKVMVLMILVVFLFISTGCVSPAISENAAEDEAKWRVTVSKDEMTGEEIWYALSPEVSSTEPMNFPYEDTKAVLGVGYNGEDEWVYIGFNVTPNPLDTTIGDGYYIITTRIKWDDEIETTKLTQEWGSKYLHFTEDEEVVSKIINSDTMLLELNWYGEGKVYFRFPLEGAAEAIDEIYSKFSE